MYVANCVRDGEVPSYSFWKRKVARKRSLSFNDLTKEKNSIFKISKAEPIKLRESMLEPPMKEEKYKILTVRNASVRERTKTLVNAKHNSSLKELIENNIYEREQTVEEIVEEEEEEDFVPKVRTRSKAVRDMQSSMEVKVKMRKSQVSKNLSHTYSSTTKEEESSDWMANVKAAINEENIIPLNNVHRAFNLEFKGIMLRKDYSEMLKHCKELILRVTMIINCGKKEFSQERNLIIKQNVDNQVLNMNKRIHFDVCYKDIPNFASIITKIYLISLSSVGDRSKICIGWCNYKLFDHMCRLKTVTT